MRRIKVFLFLGIFLMALGFSGVALSVHYNRQNRVSANQQKIVTQAKPKAVKPSTVTGVPVRLNVDSLNIQLEVVDGIYNPRNGQWTLSNNKAHFALLSQQPNNESGNTLIYGHYRPEVFAKLNKIQPNGLAYVTTNTGYKFVYKFRSTQAVNPADTAIFAYQGAPVLTLQTCSGSWMQNRQLYTFDFVGYEKV